jgi:hypothetical protein
LWVHPSVHPSTSPLLHFVDGRMVSRRTDGCRCKGGGFCFNLSAST